MYKKFETVIIGGGFSGLFFADGLLRKGYSSFIIIEKLRNKLGGLALCGGIKIGLLPAGDRTRIELASGSYEYYEDQFVKKYRRYLIAPRKYSHKIDFESHGLKNKYYYSYILSQKNGLRLAIELKNNIQNRFIYSEVIDINKTSNGFNIHLKNKSIIECNRLIIAAGRNYSITSLMKQIGQPYLRKHDMLFGCRATFDLENADKIMHYQPDLRIKDEYSYQTYCFNYRGTVISYKYNSYKIYAGSLNENRISGNCFVGSRKISTPELILNKIKEPFTISFNEFRKTKWPKSFKEDFDGLCSFMEKIESNIGLKFHKLYFPALEQFWPRPKLKSFSLESDVLPNVYFVGDSSGISFGFLQSYITANELIRILRG